MKKGNQKEAPENEWGLSMTRVSHSAFTGKGVKVALLDSGLAEMHPDFSGLTWKGRSFIAQESIEDNHGHGTHSAGLIAGPLYPGSGLRYGVAPEVNLLVGKVMSNKGLASERDLRRGIEWALAENCRVIAIPLGYPAPRKGLFDPEFEALAKKCLEANALIIASAGNHSDRRRRLLRPVAHPANCPSVFTVSGIDKNGNPYLRANSHLNAQTGGIDLVAPAVDLRSSDLPPEEYSLRSGTSGATAIVAGISALYLEAFPDMGACELSTMLKEKAKVLTLPVQDVGAGLVQAP